MTHEVSFAPLTDALIRRARGSLDASYDDVVQPGEKQGVAAGWRGDLRLFAMTWAAGFVFFLTFLA